MTITRKGQITIPHTLRQRLNLKVGDQLEFDDTAPILTAQRVVNRGNWEKTLKAWQASTDQALVDHLWKYLSSGETLNERRSGTSDND